MKKLNLVLGAAVMAACFTSCKNDAEMAAENNIDHYESYVDSIQNLDQSERQANWATIDAEYNKKLNDAQASVDNAKDKDNAQKRIDDKKQKYEEVKTSTQSSMTNMDNMNGDMDADNMRTLRISFFGESNAVGDDMDFSWVNKDNILSVYQKFVDTFKANKDNYSRQDFDKIKAWYEALDARKNTVEKEGLSAEDNNKIAALKVKFAPDFKWQRMTAKGEENEDAKEAAE